MDFVFAADGWCWYNRVAAVIVVDYFAIISISLQITDNYCKHLQLNALLKLVSKCVATSLCQTIKQN